ncbi:3' terminal RNA ribose 2'-O-methyltransferase Hen1 [Priestia abyssalis]|uniref:3' terminal RNA ribose 2'-O-methyltransferase Hen1 n=1 Tax=Priestia abyssalis TaxID=1221450 RepID=UPI000995485C|nr:3' terminal RNA ribose 2'-O-methyltransferase Hen1 [Priestia abyssalis]
MQLSIKVLGEGAENLSRLLAKNPNNLYDREEKGNRIRLVFTSSNEKEAEAVIFVTPDPVELVRNSPGIFDITQYINDREFVVSSLFCSYIRTALGTALNGKPKEEFIQWVDHHFEMEIGFGPVASRLSDQKIHELFEPLGYLVEIERGEADYSFNLKQKSSARYLKLKGRITVQQALRHLFILIPVLDNYKHYFIDEKEIEKIQRYGEGWLDEHPLRSYIIEQSLRFKELINKVPISPSIATENKVNDDVSAPPKIRLNELRYQAIIDKVESLPFHQKIVDFGSGEGKLSVRLGMVPNVQEILAVEPSESSQLRALERFEKAAGKDQFVCPTPIWGSLFYYDKRLRGKDIIILCEVIEHIDEFRLPNIMKTIFSEYQPNALIVTTPNREYNAVYDMDENIRHADHRFEWTRGEFKDWCETWVSSFPYSMHLQGIGQEYEEYGFPTQMCTFVRKEGAI